MVATVTIVALGITGLLFAGMAGALVWLFRVVDDEAEWDSEGRRRLAARSFYAGAALALLAVWGLTASFVVDVDAVAGVDGLMIGVGGVVVAALPLGIGLTLVFDAAMEP